MVIDFNCDPVGVFYRLNRASKKCIVTIGDSWTAGSGPVSRTDKSGNKKKYRDFIIEMNTTNYVHNLANVFQDYDIINVGRAGTSVESSINGLSRSLDKLTEYDKVIILFGVTSLHRRTAFLDSVKYPVDLMHQIEDIDNTKKYHPGITGDDLDYLKHMIVSSQGVGSNLYMYGNMLTALTNVCGANNFKLVTFNIFSDSAPVFPKEGEPNDLNYLRKIFEREFIKFGDHDNINNYLRMKGVDDHGDMNFYFHECHHPTVAGYKLMSDIISDYILKSKII